MYDVEYKKMLDLKACMVQTVLSDIHNDILYIFYSLITQQRSYKMIYNFCYLIKFSVVYKYIFCFVNASLCH